MEDFLNIHITKKKQNIVDILNAHRNTIFN